MNLRKLSWLPQTITAILAILVVGGAMAWLAGSFRTGKIEPAILQAPTTRPAGEIFTVTRLTRPEEVDLIGTVQSEFRSVVSARLQANIVEMKVDAGTRVKKGDILARLDDRDLKARLEQANEALRAAESQRDLAKRKVDRFTPLVEQQAAARDELDDWKSRLTASTADAVAAQQKIQEVKVALSDAVILSPMDGIVVERLADAGDMASPGKPLATIYDPGNLRLEAIVREAYIGRLDQLRKDGKAIPVVIESLHKDIPGVITQIVPLADPPSRSFTVKVHLADATDLYPGMFGRLRVPMGEMSCLEIPRTAVREVGQVSFVTVNASNHAETRVVRLGANRDGRVEVLSGLMPGEQIIVTP